MAGVSGTGSSTKASSGQHFVTTEQSAQSGAATGNTFNLRAKALAVRQGFEQVQDQSARQKQGQNNLDPAVLARMALEEELKKKGGGGGSSRPFNPMLWVPYSFKLLAQAIDQLRQALSRALDQSFFALPSFVSRTLVNTLNRVNKFLAPVTNPIMNGLTRGLNRLTRDLNNFVRNPIAASKRMLMNAAQVAMSITSAIINGLKKIFFGKDEEKQDLDETIYQDENQQGAISRLLNFFARTK